MKPIVAIVGRPNVGKSTLFNRIAGARIAIVEDTPGVTRDRIYTDAEWLTHTFTLIDTGGIEPQAQDEIMQQMQRQAELAVDTADVIIFLVDGREGFVSADMEVANILRRSKKPIVLAVNKVDNTRLEDNQYDFYQLAVGEPVTISAQQGLGIGDLLDAVTVHFPQGETPEAQGGAIRIAVIGKPNVGKSSLVNAMLREERSIVSDVPGTTRDAIDTPLTFEGKDYVLIDTAGIRRKRSIDPKSIERYSVVRALSAVRRCDVALVVVDAEEGVTEQDTKIAGYVHEEGKASVIVINKWDLIEKDTHTLHKYEKKVLNELAFMSYAKTMFVSARTGQRLHRVLKVVDEVYEQFSRRISTGLLNDILGEALLLNEPPADAGRRLKVYYATQASTKPPTFVIFVNQPELMHFSYQRYLENYLRKSFGFEGTPIRFILRQRKE
ncbi:MAG: ribosome biogenesis GTPase Der [Bacillota bacterium]